MNLQASGMSGRAGLCARVLFALADIKIAHSVFALPFAFLAAFLAFGSSVPASEVAGKLVLVVLCMVAARTWAMLVNRVADHRIDAANPRTAGRAIAAGRLPVRDGVRFAMVAAGFFVVSCAGFWWWYGNPWPVALSVPVLAWVASYSYAKRFTLLCHVFLGAALASSPVASVLAVDPAALAQPTVWWLAGMVLLWVAGFDVLYALQDESFDRAAGLHSVPAALGRVGALRVSAGLHAGSALCLLQVWWSEPAFGLLFGSVVGVVSALLCAEHVAVRRSGLRAVPMAFFTLNGIVSLLVGAVGVLDVLV